MFLCAHGIITPTPNAKAAERTAALHDAGARFAIPLETGEAFGVRLSFLALSMRWYVSVRADNHSTPPSKSGRRDSRTPRRWREVRTPLLLEKFLDCACLLWRFSFDAHKSPTSSAAVVSTAFPRNRASFSRAGSGHANHSKSAGEPAEQASAPDAAGVLHAGLPLLSSAR